MTRILEAKGLTKSFGNRLVVDKLNLEVKPGQVVGLLGPNGAGKTTTFKMILGLLRQDTGEVRFGDVPLDGKPLHLRARLGLGYLPQGAGVFQGLTARQNIMAVIEEIGISSPDKEVEKLLSRFHLVKLADQKARTLSGGERRRLALALALASRPQIILCDEPFAGIDPIAQNDISDVILGLKTDGVGILITDHSVRKALGICDFVHLIVEGQIVEKGTPKEILESDIAKRLYLGAAFDAAIGTK